MAKVEFGKIDFTRRFEDLDIGTYFKFEGELFVKLRIAKEEDDAYGDEGEEVNAFSFATDDTTFFEDYDEVTPIPTEAIRFIIGRKG
jgi:hypothetical protein